MIWQVLVLLCVQAVASTAGIVYIVVLHNRREQALLDRLMARDLAEYKGLAADDREDRPPGRTGNIITNNRIRQVSGE